MEQCSSNVNVKDTKKFSLFDDQRWSKKSLYFDLIYSFSEFLASGFLTYIAEHFYAFPTFTQFGNFTNFFASNFTL